MDDSAVLEHYLAPLRPLLAQDDVTELVINRPGEVGIEQGGRWRWHEEPLLTEAWLRTLAVAAAAFTKQDVSDARPICSTTLPGDERCQIVLPPAAPTGTVSLTIRKPSRRQFGLDAFATGGLFDAVVAADDASADPVDAELLALKRSGDWSAFFKLAVVSRRNILVSGATGSGKTTFAKGLVEAIPDHERLLTIEDTRELVVPHRNVVHLTYSKEGQGLAQVTAKSLLESALRMRPDRILLQELRDGTAFFYPDAVADMLKIAQHRGWTGVRVSGDEGFRREAWIQARSLGVEVKGYRPRDRDRQAAGESSLARSPSSRHLDERTVKDRLRAASVVVKRLIDDPAARTRLMERAVQRLHNQVDPARTRDRDGSRDRRS
nr:P-type DNA transfer ATPase VirB11 [uncultured Brevundimonas sp.]